MRFAKRTNWDLELNPLAKAVAEHRAAGKPLIDLTVSNPTECGFVYDTEAILGALRNAEAMKYEPHPKGLEVARRAVAGYYADRGDSVSIEDIFMTTSTSEGYSWLMRLLCDVGDEVLIPSPGYPLFDFLADLNDVKLVRYPLFYDHGWHFDFHALEQAITERTRAIIVVHPNNPTGNYVKPKERERLNQICAERGLALIADEVFLDFALDGVPRASFATNGNEDSKQEARSVGMRQTFGREDSDGEAASEDSGRAAASEETWEDPEREGTKKKVEPTQGGPHAPLTFTLSGISKICGLPQMKVAWIVLSGREADKRAAADRLEIIADTYLSMNAPMQLALPRLLGGRGPFRDQVVKRLGVNLSQLERPEFSAAKVEALSAEGGWQVVIQERSVCGIGEQNEKALIEIGEVTIHPGRLFGMTGAFLVASLISDAETFRRGTDRLMTTLLALKRGK